VESRDNKEQQNNEGKNDWCIFFEFESFIVNPPPQRTREHFQSFGEASPYYLPHTIFLEKPKSPF